MHVLHEIICTVDCKQIKWDIVQLEKVKLKNHKKKKKKKSRPEENTRINLNFKNTVRVFTGKIVIWSF